ncbi:MAG: DUF1932 domain-containing protein [Rhodospirillales bacterium]
MTFNSIAIIGFGEAGPAFARGFRNSGTGIARAFDIAYGTGSPSDAVFEARAKASGTELKRDRADAVRGAELIICTVTADLAEVAAEQVAPSLRPGQIYFDLNSCAPARKKAIAAVVTKAGASFVEGVAMDTVPKMGFQVPLLLAGPDAAGILDRLTAHGMVAEVAGPELGQASSVKLLRSVLIKGMEALFAESVAAATVIGVQDQIIGSLAKTYPGLDWHEIAGYQISRLAIHGKRRAAEMRESADTVRSLGIEPLMATAIAERQQWAADIDLKAHYMENPAETIENYKAALSTRRTKA